MLNDVAERRSARERILETAGTLFYAEGIHAVGVERVVTESGVAKATLYQHFRSKDALVAACLERRAEDWRCTVADQVLAQTGTPTRRVSKVFELLRAAFATPAYRGCPFINAAAEYPDRDGPVAAVIVAHRRDVRELFVALLAELPAQRNELADQLVLLYDGAMVGAQLGDGARAARRAQTAARTLLAAR
jgi:AcrR family transcriptional regulator